MKKYVISLVIVLTTLLSYTQIQFKEEIVSNRLIKYPFSMCSFDVDQDTDLDLIIADTRNNRIIWYENSGSGTFGNLHVLIDDVYCPIQIEISEIDGDGYKDLVIPSSDGDKIFWFKNDGFGSFTQNYVDTFIDSPVSIFCADLDNDNDIDILSTSFLGNKIVYYENDGLGNFGSQQIISTAVNAPRSVFAADLDNDEFLDVITASFYDTKVAWYKNLSNGSFGQQSIISQQVFVPLNVTASDLDGDGDMDVISASGDTPNNKIFWFKNDGVGTFSIQQTLTPIFVPGRTISTLDIDDDNDMDIITPSHIFKNNGVGVFDSMLIVDKVAYISCIADFDNDSDLDIAYNFNVVNLAWRANDGNGNFGGRNEITYSFDKPATLVYKDIDGDNLKDIIVGSNDKYLNVCWLKNNGNGNYSVVDTINTGFSHVADIWYVDLDGDSLPDMLSSYYDSGDNIGWNKQDSTGQFGPIQVVRDSTFMSQINVEDMDGDGDMDILFGYFPGEISLNGSQLSMLLNDGNGNFGTEIALWQCYWFPCDIKTFDFNNDGNMDILFTDYRVTVGMNQGGNNFQFINIGQNTQETNAVNAADLDGDGDLDVVYSCDSTNPYGSHLAWMQNDGNGNFTSMPPLFPSWLTEEIELVDMDKDGDIDIIADQSTEDNTLFWMENDGLGNFVYTTGGYTWNIQDSIEVTSLVVDDMDGDGDNDVLYNSINDGLIAWAENLGFQNADSASACANEPYQLGNQTLTSPGTYIDSLQTIFGLDSIIEVAFTHIPIPQVELDPFFTDTVCVEEMFLQVPFVNPSGGVFSDTSIQNNLVDLYAAGEGIYELIYSFTDSATGCSNSDSSSIMIVTCTLIEQVGEELGVNVYPNPSSGVLNVEFESHSIKHAYLKLYDPSGQELLTKETLNSRSSIDLSAYNAGIYYLRIETEIGSEVLKLILN